MNHSLIRYRRHFRYDFCSVHTFLALALQRELLGWSDSSFVADCDTRSDVHSSAPQIMSKNMRD